MRYFEVAPVKIFRSDSDVLTYSSGLELAVGHIVQVPVGKNNYTGIVIKETKKPTFKTKPISKLLFDTPLPSQLTKLARWMSGYYHTPLANTIQTLLPSGAHKKRRTEKKSIHITKRKRTNIVFNNDQQQVFDTLCSARQGTFLLQGVTGSGKTELYIRLTKQILSLGRSAIILVPEISLTSQIVAEFSNEFTDILLTHSAMTESERHLVWLEALNSEHPRIVIGPRSALFTPLKDVGLIVVDESHEPGYKQEQSPKYSAIRAATVLGKLHNALVILGSATPDMIDRFLAEASKSPVLRLPKVARPGSQLPTVSIIDMKDRSKFTKHRFLSTKLLDQISNNLKQAKQTLIFHNRRGSANSSLCKNCGWTAQCPRCYIPLTLHSNRNELLCHICGYHGNIPHFCPECKEADIVFRGIGTQLIEAELKKIYPNARIARFDADNKNDETVNSRYDDLYHGNIDIAIGTQVIAKGLDLPRLRTVGIIQADTGLALPDYNSTERVFQLIAQATGRVGRNKHKTQVIIQTYQPQHPSVQFGAYQDYESFYNNELTKRQNGHFPPFTHLLKLTCVYKTESAAIKNSQIVAKQLRKILPDQVQIFGPTPAFYERVRNTFRWQVVIKSPKREYLMQALDCIPAMHWQSELDPASLL